MFSHLSVEENVHPFQQTTYMSNII